MPSRPLVLSLIVGAFSIVACDGPPPSPDANASAASSADADPESCAKYSAELCTQAGEESPTCDAVKTTTALMPPAACAAGLADIDFAVKRIQDEMKVCTELMEKLCKDLGEETQTCKMVQDQTSKFPPEQCVSMMENYPAVLADLTQMEARNKPLAADAVAAIAAGPAPDFGPADAKVTVVEFSDFQCPYCSKAADAVNEVKGKYKDKARFVFRQFPLSFHKEAHLAAQASLAAHEQGKFWEYHDALFANQRQLDRDSLEKYAKDLGLDMGAFKKALDDGTHAKAVDTELALGQTVFVDGTPTMFVNGKRVENPTDVDSISKTIDEALAGG
jgi:protein-disulfide isomerase